MTRREPQLAVLCVATLSLTAAAAHLMVTREHFEEWWAYGLFFLVAAAGQALFALLVVRRAATWLLLAGIAGNLALVGMYVLSRTNGPPLGPHANHPEDAALFDLLCNATEIGVIVASIALLPAVAARRTATGLMFVGSALWGARFTGILL